MLKEISGVTGLRGIPDGRVTKMSMAVTARRAKLPKTCSLPAFMIPCPHG
jgi:hypothetical protein